MTPRRLADARPHSLERAQIFFPGPRLEDATGCVRVVVRVVETDAALGGDLEATLEWKRKVGDVASRALECVIDKRRCERRVPTTEKLVSFHVDARCLFVIEVELDPTLAQRASSVHPAGEPQVVKRARPLDVEDHMLTALVDVVRGVRPIETVVVPAATIVARQVVRLNVGP